MTDKLNRHTSNLTSATVKSTPAQRQICHFSGQSTDRMQLGLRQPTEFFADCLGPGRPTAFLPKILRFLHRSAHRSAAHGRWHAWSRGQEVYLNSSVRLFNQNESRWPFARKLYLFKLDQYVSSMSATMMHTVAHGLGGAFPPAHGIGRRSECAA
jgi:hypothetical protein